MVKYVLFLIVFVTSVLGQTASKTLNWTTIDPIDGTNVDLSSHGSIQYHYLLQNKLPDPFFGENEQAYQWFEDYDWNLSSVFDVEDISSSLDYYLEFENIDTYAVVFLNNKEVYKADNAFIPHKIKVTNDILLGKNIVKVVFKSPVQYHKDNQQYNFTFPAPNDVDSLKVAPLTRKAQYQFGWDWAPRINTIGFLKPVKLVSKFKGQFQINHPYTQLIQKAKNYAVIESIIEVDGAYTNYHWKSDLFGSKFLKVTNGKLVRLDTIQNPEYWYPNGLGKQKLYKDKWFLETSGFYFTQEINTTFGLRTAELVNEKDDIGENYYILFNGKKTFCKGANYIPQDVFPSRITKTGIREVVQQMADANFNMVRVWGGGYYPEDYFFELCDSLGIMVWQDFMFACAMYPADDAFLKNVEKEATYEVRRLRNHPSLVLFNGNNEVEVAWGNWGFQKRYSLDSLAQNIISKAYDTLFKKVLPKIVKANCNISYIHTSPLSNWGKPAYFKSGTMHYWGVWHGQDPLSDLWKKSGRFNAEFGFQSFPSISTINSFASEKDKSLKSDVMKNHQKSYVGNNMISKHSDSLYGIPKDFNDFVYKSQLTQAFSIGNAVVSHRLNYPICTGTLFWQFNDCWPAPTWSAIDYYGNKKALYYTLKDAFASIAVVKDERESTPMFYIINEREAEGYIGVKAELFDLNGSSLIKTDLGLYFKAGEYKRKITLGKILENQKELSRILRLTWKDLNKTYSKDFVLGNKKNLKPVSSSNFYPTNISFDENGKTGELRVFSGLYIDQLWISHPTIHTNFENNFSSILPGYHVYKFECDQSFELKDLNFLYLNPQ